MVKEDWYYLVRGKEVVLLTNKKPRGTSFSPAEFTWTMDGREFLAGCPDPMFLVDDEDWVGTIGVFNMKNQIQVVNAFRLMRNHIIYFCRHSLKKNLRKRNVALLTPPDEESGERRATAVGGAVHETFAELMEMDSLRHLM